MDLPNVLFSDLMHPLSLPQRDRRSMPVCVLFTYVYIYKIIWCCHYVYVCQCYWQDHWLKRQGVWCLCYLVWSLYIVTHRSLFFAFCRKGCRVFFLDVWCSDCVLSVSSFVGSSLVIGLAPYSGLSQIVLHAPEPARHFPPCASTAGASQLAGALTRFSAKANSYGPILSGGGGQYPNGPNGPNGSWPTSVSVSGVEPNPPSTRVPLAGAAALRCRHRKP